MFGFFRAARVAAAFTLLVSAFAAPSMAAEAQPVQLASLSPIPAVTSFQPQQSEVSTPLVAPQGAVDAAAQTAEAPDAAPATTLPGTVRALRDMVLAFVDYGTQDEQEDCLAKAVYFEARSESLEGQLAVADVILNRAASGIYPPTICDVVTQPAQFSFIRAGRFPTPDVDSSAWHTALAIADIAQKRLAQQLAPNVLWYHATYVAPSWGRRLNSLRPDRHSHLLQLIGAGGLMAAGFLSLIAAAMAAALQPAAFVGEYDGGQTEIAAGIELRADGRFRYGLSYGALDEQAEGRWRAEGNQVLLTSDPVKAPQFILLTKRKGAPNALEIEVERPEGLPLGLFDVAVTFRSGRMQIEQLSDQGLLFDPGDPPTNMVLVLRIFDLVGDPLPISPADGYRLSFRFDPNDLGKVDFRDAALAIEGKDLLLERHDRKLRFRRISR